MRAAPGRSEHNHTAAPAEGRQPRGAAEQRLRGRWLKTLHQWHWISSALCLAGMLLFSITGITLNNAGRIESEARVTQWRGQLPAPLVHALQQGAAGPSGTQALPAPLQRWLRTEWRIETAGHAAEWSQGEVYLALPRPGGDGWLRIALPGGAIEAEASDRGWVAYLNDLHKGRHTGAAWSWFIDLFAAACLVFSLTGLCILALRAGGRPATWPLTGLGLLLPIALAMLFIH